MMEKKNFDWKSIRTADELEKAIARNSQKVRLKEERIRSGFVSVKSFYQPQALLQSGSERLFGRFSVNDFALSAIGALRKKLLKI